MAGSVGQNESVQRRLDKAYAYVSDYWFPANSALIEKLKIGLKEGRYDFDVRSLVSEVKGDFSLYMYCLKELIRTLRDEGLDTPASPLELFEVAGLERLKKILSIEATNISRHSITEISDLQAVRFEEVMVSASTAELLSENYDVDPELGFTAACLRQLGHTLIAWNYPKLYEEVISTLKTGDQLDIMLARKLGFSPALLAMKVVRSWGVPKELYLSLECEEESEDIEEDEILDSISDVITRACKVGEALARASSGNKYPQSKEDWDLAKLEIETHLGSRGMDIVREKYEEHLENYVSALPEMFQGGVILDPEYRKHEEERAEKLQERNPFVLQCRPRIKRKLSAFYEKLTSEHVDKENLKFLVREIVPYAEFTGGCVYTVDPGLMMLVPQLDFGVMWLRGDEAVDYSIARSNSDMVAVAFRSNDPVVEYKLGPEGHALVAISGIFGVSQRVGIMYLEIPEIIYSQEPTAHLIHFKALVQSLNDSLSLH